MKASKRRKRKEGDLHRQSVADYPPTPEETINAWQAFQNKLIPLVDGPPYPIEDSDELMAYDRKMADDHPEWRAFVRRLCPADVGFFERGATHLGADFEGDSFNAILVVVVRLELRTRKPMLVLLPEEGPIPSHVLFGAANKGDDPTLN